MTSKEASEVLKASSIQQMSFCKVVVNGKAFNVKEALDMAIKSLEAWEKVKEEIESKMVSLEGLYSYEKAYHDSCNNARKECIEIIDKHLTEVENESC